MTMFPAPHHHHRQNLIYKQQHCYVGGSYCYPEGGGFGGVMNRLEEGYENCSGETAYCLLGGSGSDLVVGPAVMATEDESRTESTNLNEEEAASSSKDVIVHHRQEGNDNNNDRNEDDDDWLQLSIGSGGHTHSKKHHQGEADDQQQQQSSQRRRTSDSHELVELNLLPGSTTSSSEHGRFLLSSSSSRFHPAAQEFQTPPSRPLTHYGYGPSVFMQQQHQGAAGSSSSAPHHHHHHQDFNWVYSPAMMPYPRPHHLGFAASSSSTPSPSSFLMQPGAYIGSRLPFQVIHPRGGDNNMVLRVINPPRRPQSGIWFMLQASQNQAKEPFLPQIPKSYLRIKDGRMTIGLVIKYLVNKLRLESESEVEITCRGQQLVPFLTLQHVRDNIWCVQRSNTTTTTTLLPETSTAVDHIMVLHYSRRCA